MSRRILLAILFFPVAGCAAEAPPITASAGRCGLGLDGWGAEAPGLRPANLPVRNLLAVDRTGALVWNGTRVTAKAVRQYLEITTTMRPPPVFKIEADRAAPCAAVAEAVAIADGVLGCTPRQCRFSWSGSG